MHKLLMDSSLEQVKLLPVAQEAVRKHSVILIAKRLKIDLHNLEAEVLTDRKWLLFILEQLASNAANYTEQGTIAIYQPAPLQICVSDTGMGIAAEDMPRLFEKGYTGFNGHIHQKSTGCGLYMCKKVSRLLGLTSGWQQNPHERFFNDDCLWVAHGNNLRCIGWRERCACHE